MAKLDERIATLKERLKELETEKQLKNARQRAVESRRSRAAELRRKILVGAVVLSKVEGGEFDREQLQRWLDEGLTRAEDRELFGLGASEGTDVPVGVSKQNGS